jgi:acetylornithine deacetylase/succinyl-diaminopimelate desuccinylase-like protein
MTTPGPQGLDVLDIARELVSTSSPNPPGDERAAAALVQNLLPELLLPGARVIVRNESSPICSSAWISDPEGGTLYSRATSTPSPSPTPPGVWIPSGLTLRETDCTGLAPRT